MEMKMNIGVKGKTVKNLIKALKELDENRPLEDFCIEHTVDYSGHFGEISTQTDSYIFTFKISDTKNFNYPK